MEIKVNDKFVFHSKNGMDYQIEIVSVNEFRDPWEKYGCDIWDGNGVYAGDVTFIGDNFFDQFKNQFERIKNWNK